MVMASMLISTVVTLLTAMASMPMASLGVIGTKTAIVPTSQGQRELYSQESPEVWFEDFGEGQLTGGLAHIELDPLFLETVTIDDKHPMKVFIQLNDDCNGVYVQRQATGFTVTELAAATAAPISPTGWWPSARAMKIPG